MVILHDNLQQVKLKIDDIDNSNSNSNSSVALVLKQPKKMNNLQCANCGGIGHVYKNCNHPVTSYGIICFYITFDKNMMPVPKYLMVQRKDSLSYVEFLRGKYNIDQKHYLMKLFSHMTVTERENIRTKSFDDLWNELWLSDESKGYYREYNDARLHFETLKKGYIIKNETNDILYFDINFIINNTRCSLKESEWGFPKGRRNINEADIDTALRECREESGIDTYYVNILNNMKPFEEIFTGSNKVRYRHVYYIGYCSKPKKHLFNPKNKLQSREIKDVKWFNYDIAQTKISQYNIERKEILKRVHASIFKNNIINYYNYNNGYNSIVE